MYKLLFFIVTVVFSLAAAPGCSSTTETKRNAELTVHYDGKLVHKAHPIYKNEQEFRILAAPSDGKKFIIFSADWCKSCDFLIRALKQGNYFEEAIFINIDDPWVQKLAQVLNVRSIPAMVVVDEQDMIQQILTGPSKIVMHFVINVEK